MLSNLSLNLAQAMGFGLQVKQNGKDYVSIMRMNERLFMAIDPLAPMPAPILLVQADIAVQGEPVQQQDQGGQAQTPAAVPAADANNAKAETEKTPVKAVEAPVPTGGDAV